MNRCIILILEGKWKSRDYLNMDESRYTLWYKFTLTVGSL